MKINSIKNKCLFALLTLGFSVLSNAQDGSVSINQNPEITELLEFKKQINTEESDTNRYKIQIFSGSMQRAQSMENKFDLSFNSWASKIEYETPNYKVWVGSFRNRLDAERALLEIKKKFPTGTFIFKPKKKN